MLTWNFGGGPSDSALTFFKMESAYGNFLYENDFHAFIIIIGCQMLDNDNIMNAKASEVVQKVPTDEKRLSQMLLVRNSFHIATTHVCEHVQQKKLDVNKAPPAKLKETAEDILKFAQKKVQ